MADGDYERRDNKLRELSQIAKRLKELRSEKEPQTRDSSEAKRPPIN